MIKFLFASSVNSCRGRIAIFTFATRGRMFEPPVALGGMTLCDGNERERSHLLVKIITDNTKELMFDELMFFARAMPSRVFDSEYTHVYITRIIDRV